jgi:hypothetical protein
VDHEFLDKGICGVGPTARRADGHTELHLAVGLHRWTVQAGPNLRQFDRHPAAAATGDRPDSAAINCSDRDAHGASGGDESLCAAVHVQRRTMRVADNLSVDSRLYLVSAVSEKLEILSLPKYSAVLAPIAAVGMVRDTELKFQDHYRDNDT